jgi:hypothetical protein
MTRRRIGAVRRRAENSAELLEKKFEEAMRKAKETPDTGKPLREFDLD